MSFLVPKAFHDRRVPPALAKKLTAMAPLEASSSRPSRPRVVAPTFNPGGTNASVNLLIDSLFRRAFHKALIRNGSVYYRRNTSIDTNCRTTIILLDESSDLINFYHMRCRQSIVREKSMYRGGARRRAHQGL